LITRIKCGEEYRTWSSSLYIVLHSWLPCASQTQISSSAPFFRYMQ
jgi:hypothetical protein